MAELLTADLCDVYSDELQIAEPVFRSFGGRDTFHGEAAIVSVFEDNVLVKQRLQEEGRGRVLVVDGGGSTRVALMGDNVASLARDNGWAGIVIHGCIRDSVEVAAIDLGVLALATCPRKSFKEGRGDIDVEVAFAGVRVQTGDWIYVDPDGLLIAPRELSLAG